MIAVSGATTITIEGATTITIEGPLQGATVIKGMSCQH